MSDLKLYNVRTRQIETFSPINDGVVKMYSCGPTVYSTPHIGNMRAYALTGLLRNVFERAGYQVENAVNLTDVGHLVSDANDGEDKLQKEAQRQRRTAWDISKEYSQIFFDYLEALSLPDATHYPLATDYIREQIEFVEKLEAKGVTYRTDDGIYFDSATFPRYADFAQLDVDGLEAGTRVSFEGKRNKTDFALWKFSREGEKRDMEWDSPWGVGFPGWHIECSAMAMALLGEQIDIHTGGIDHANVHHTNEIAQTETLTGKRFANFWLHVHFLHLEKQDEVPEDLRKMSKSKGNVITIDSLIEQGHSPIALKFMYYLSHYRSEMEFSVKALEAAEKSLNRLLMKAYNIRQQSNGSQQHSEALGKIKDAINNDLNTPKAIGLLHVALSDDELNTNQKMTILDYADAILGVGLMSYVPARETIPESVTSLADERKEARLSGNWEKSDKLRDSIIQLGYTIKDLPGHEYEITAQ